MLEEQQSAIKKAVMLKLQNEKLETVIMNTATRMREPLVENEKKDAILKQLEQNQNDVREIYEKEISLLKIQLDNHEEKEQTMNGNLVHYMDENVRLKNQLRVEKDRSPGKIEQESKTSDLSSELNKLM